MRGHPHISDQRLSLAQYVVKSYEFSLDQETIDLLFAEVARIRKEHPEQCLTLEQLWSDTSEKANGITRDRSTGTLCYTVSIFRDHHMPEEQFALRGAA